ncbi:pentapeptide repeat-containing protein [Paenibacillus sp. NPDC058174]|uniref:pentapeptide repeat-containing protein n=1 Tax=Paenibacillus sp. NPDC058174 TaxID=3346366 RepID=UPI0036D85C90
MSDINSNPLSLTDQRRAELLGDCENCFGLCCVALPFGASSDFAVDKNAGQACNHLQQNFRCGIHDRLRPQGFRGCTVYDCFGAGQKISNTTFKGKSWREAPETAKLMFDVLPVMRQLQELLWYINEALTYPAARSLHEKLGDMYDQIERLTLLRPEEVMKLDIITHRMEVNELLLQISEDVRRTAASKAAPQSKGGKRTKKIGRGADLIGANMKGADLRGANLRGALLIAANFANADLRGADLIGADFRDTDLGGADLTESIFLTQSQLNAAKGNDATKLPPSLSRPAHWTTVAR